MERYNMKEAPKIVVPPPYSMDPDGKTLRWKGVIVKNCWEKGGLATQQQVDKFIAARDRGLDFVREIAGG